MYIDVAKDQWLQKIANSNHELLIDFCEVDPTLMGCDDPYYK